FSSQYRIRMFQTLQPKNSTPRSGMTLATTRATRAPTDEPTRYQATRRSTPRMVAARPPTIRPLRVAGRALRLRLRGGDRQGPFLGAADDRELEGSFQGDQGVVQIVGIGDGPVAGRDDEIAGLDPGLRRRAAVLDATDQHPVTVRQPDRAPQSTRNVIRGDR